MAATHGNTTSVSWNGHVIGEVTGIGDLNITYDKADASIYNAANAFKQKLLGLKDAADIPITCNLDVSDTDGQIAFITDFNNKTERNLVITFPTAMGATWTIPCLPSGLGTATPKDDKISITLTVTPNGLPVWAVATVTGMSAVGFSNDVLMMPSFAIGVFDYVVTITAAEVSTVVTPVDATSGEVITITTDGGSSQVVATGEASSACVLDVDDMTDIVVTISKTNYAPKVYTFHCAVLAA